MTPEYWYTTARGKAAGGKLSPPDDYHQWRLVSVAAAVTSHNGMLSDASTYVIAAWERVEDR